MSEVSVETLKIENLNLRAELQRVRQIASDRLVFIRVLETFVNDVGTCDRRLKNDLSEISKQVASRNSMPQVQEADEEE